MFRFKRNKTAATSPQFQCACGAPRHWTRFEHNRFDHDCPFHQARRCPSCVAETQFAAEVERELKWVSYWASDGEL